MQTVSFHSSDISLTLKERTRLKLFITQIFTRNKKRLQQLSHIFCSDDYLLSINQQFLNHDYYTDIITFDLSDSAGLTTGEIYISVDRVRDNASQNKASFKEELHRVIFHGVLHLCGYKDKSTKDAARMRQAENDCLDAYFKSVPRGNKL